MQVGGGNRSFALLLASICAIVAAAIYPGNGRSYLIWALLSVVLSAIGFAVARVLAPLRRAWLRVGALLGPVINPVVLGTVFFVVIVPVGGLMRLFGKDSLALRRGSAGASYWITRNDGSLDADRLKEQF